MSPMSMTPSATHLSLTQPVDDSSQPNTAAPTPAPTEPCRRIQVSREKRSLNFFVTLSKKFLISDEVIELSGLGLAVTTVVTIAELLKGQGLVSLESIKTSLVEPHPDGGSAAPKAKIQIWVRKTEQFHTILATHNPKRQAPARDRETGGTGDVHRHPRERDGEKSPTGVADNKLATPLDSPASAAADTGNTESVAVNGRAEKRGVTVYSDRAEKGEDDGIRASTKA